MVSEMQLARRQLDKELNRHNIPDALQVLDRAVGGLIDLAKSRVGDGVTNAKEVKNPFGDPPGIPGAGKADGNYRLPKFAGVYSNTQSVPKNKQKAKSESSTALPTAAGNMRLGKANDMAEGGGDDDDEGYGEGYDDGEGDDSQDDGQGMGRPRYKAMRRNEEPEEEEDDEYDDDEDDGEGNPDDPDEFVDDDDDGDGGNPDDPDGDDPDDDNDPDADQDPNDPENGESDRRAALEALLSRNSKYDTGPGMRPRQPGAHAVPDHHL